MNKGLAVKRTAGMNRRPGVANEDAGWEYWRALAEEARTCAAQMREPAAQRILHDISAAYATLAQRAKPRRRRATAVSATHQATVSLIR
jgi:hypothetical protein